MRAAAAPHLESATWLWRARLSSLLADLGYLCAICVAAIASFAVIGAFGAPPNIPGTALQRALLTVIVSTVHIYPYLPICAIAANLAPATGLGRYVCFGAAGALALVW